MKKNSLPGLSLAIATLCALLIENVLAHYGDVPNYMRSQLLHMAYYKPVRIERVFAALKFDAFDNDQSEIVQIGDSSGFVSIKPKIIETYLPKGWHYINASLQVPAQFEGIEALAENILSKDKKRRYLYGMFSLFNFGNKDDGFGGDITLNYRPPWNILFRLPSLKYREPVLRTVYLSAAGKFLELQPEYINFYNTLISERGWIGVRFNTPYLGENCNITTYNSDLAISRMERLYALAQKYKVTLMLDIGPVKCNADETIHHIEHDFNAFHTRHPDVIFPLKIYTQLPPALVGDNIHLTPEGADYYSNIIGKTLSKIINNNALIYSPDR